MEAHVVDSGTETVMGLAHIGSQAGRTSMGHMVGTIESQSHPSLVVVAPCLDQGVNFAGQLGVRIGSWEVH